MDSASRILLGLLEIFLLQLLLVSKNRVEGFSTTTDQRLKVVFVTGNAMKAKEVEAILLEECDSIELSILDVDLPELQEVNTMAIAKQKAILAAQLADCVVVEDTSLCFHALGNMPGPYIKWFQETLQSEGLYNILSAYPDKTATAICTLAFCPERYADPILFTGTCRGTIVPPEPGRGFGWDSIFVPESSDLPFSKLALAEKNKLSHRGDAVRQFGKFLQKNFDSLIKRRNNDSVLGHQGLKFDKDDSPPEGMDS